MSIKGFGGFQALSLGRLLKNFYNVSKVKIQNSYLRILNIY